MGIGEDDTQYIRELQRMQLSSRTCRKFLVNDDAAEALAALEDMESAVRLVDAMQNIRNVTVDWQLAGEVLVNELRDIGARLPAPECSANPAASRD